MRGVQDDRPTQKKIVVDVTTSFHLHRLDKVTNRWRSTASAGEDDAPLGLGHDGGRPTAPAPGDQEGRVRPALEARGPAIPEVRSAEALADTGKANRPGRPVEEGQGRQGELGAEGVGLQEVQGGQRGVQGPTRPTPIAAADVGAGDGLFAGLSLASAVPGERSEERAAPAPAAAISPRAAPLFEGLTIAEGGGPSTTPTQKGGDGIFDGLEWVGGNAGPPSPAAPKADDLFQGLELAEPGRPGAQLAPGPGLFAGLVLPGEPVLADAPASHSAAADGGASPPCSDAPGDAAPGSGQARATQK